MPAQLQIFELFNRPIASQCKYFLGDSLLMGEVLRQFVGSMMGADLATEHVTVVTTFDKSDGSG